MQPVLIVSIIISFVIFLYNFICYNDVYISLYNNEKEKLEKANHKKWFELSGIIFIISLLMLVTI